MKFYEGHAATLVHCHEDNKGNNDIHKENKKN